MTTSPPSSRARPVGHRRAGARLLVPVAPTGLADSVSQQLADAIHVGLLAIGEQLPAETELASQLGVSTVTLRDALATLRDLGLVETRRGRNGGSFVVGPGPVPAPERRARLRERLRRLSVVELRDLTDEWTAISGTSARLAAARASESEIARLRTDADELAGAEHVPDRVRATGRFGIDLALASQSERLTRAEVRLHAEVGELLWTPTETPLSPHAVAADLHAIVDAVAAEDGALARERAEARTRQNVRWLIDAHLEVSDDA